MVVDVTNRRYFREPVSAVFEGRDIFCPVAAHISNGVKLTELGRTIDPSDLVWAEFPLEEKGGQLIGEVLFIDKFGNLISSIKRESFRKFLGRRPRGPMSKPFDLRLGDATITEISHTYANGKAGEPLAIFGGDFGDLLDIAVCEDSAAEKLGVKVGDEVIIKRR